MILADDNSRIKALPPYELRPKSYELLFTRKHERPRTRTRTRTRAVACPLLPAPYYLLPTTYYLLPTTYYLLPTSYFLLPTTYYLLFTHEDEDFIR
jgi:hypothetical protein